MSRTPGAGEWVRVQYVVGNFIASGAERHLLEMWRPVRRHEAFYVSALHPSA